MVAQPAVADLALPRADHALVRAAAHLDAAGGPVLLRDPLAGTSRKAEWALSRAGIPYRALDVAGRQLHHVRRANPVERDLPVLAAAHEVLQGDHAILRWADARRTPSVAPFYPSEAAKQVLGWETWADESAGPVVARVSARLLARNPAVQGDNAWQKVRLRLSRGGFRALARRLHAHDSASRDDEALPALLAHTIDGLRETDTGFLVTDHPTAADIAVAAHFMPLVRLAPRLDLHLVDGWGELVQFLRTIRPARLRLTGARRVREADWLAFEAILRHQETLPRPLSGQPA